MSELVPKPDPKTAEPFEDDAPVIEVGQWYWVKDRRNGAWNPTAKRKHKDDYEWLGCIVHIGSNFVKLEAPNGSYDRVHMDLVHKRLRFEPNPKAVIGERVAWYRGAVQQKIGEVKAITARLGVSPRMGIEQKGDASSRGLIALSETPDVKKYKKSLIRAKEKDLPKLFEEIKEANSAMAIWMSAEAIPMKATAEGMKGCVKEVEDRIFNVSLYAGLTEDVVKASGGEPAGFDEKLHLMQRRLYMDEECLVNYKHGGMDFDHIKQFDSWLAMPENRDRILPFPRCMTAFRVRRNHKERDWDGTIAGFFLNFKLEKLDELTFLYIRNGERVYRMNCDLEFGNMIFPSAGEFDPSEPMMIKKFGGSVDDIIPRREYEDRHKEEMARKAKYDKWTEDNPGKSWIENPHHHSWWHDSDWDPFDKTSVFYDEATQIVENQIKQYNRIVLIVQGLFDRSEVLHPHPPVKTWTSEGFAAAIKLVYDGDNTLHHGEAPDFEVYRARCNASLKDGSVTIGQQDCWERREAVKENKRRYSSWNWKRDFYEITHHQPYGNSGPGFIVRVGRWNKKSQEATFRWKRERRNYSWRGGAPGDPMPCNAKIPAKALFNVSAYKPGDFKQFFQDPRTRAQYLKWAPTLLVAEEYHAGNIEIDDALDGETLAKRLKKKARSERAKAKRKARKGKGKGKKS